MNESIDYGSAVQVASSPESLSQASALFREIMPVVAFMMFVPLALYVGATFVWSLRRDHKYGKLWNNDDFWMGLILILFSMLAMLAFSPYLFIYLV